MANWEFRDLARVISPNRLAPFLDSNAPLDINAALARYEWNIEASGAAMEMISIVEIIVRNSMDSALKSWSTAKGMGFWPIHLHLDHQGNKAIQVALSRSRGWGHDRVIAELPLGFWRYLCAERYLTSIWIPALIKAFPNSPLDARNSRTMVYALLTRVHKLRNAAAHHESLLERDLSSDYRAAYLLVSMINVTAAVWFSETVRMAQIIEARPRY